MNPTQRLACLDRILVGLVKILLKTDSREIIAIVESIRPELDKLHEDLVDENIKWITSKHEEA